ATCCTRSAKPQSASSPPIIILCLIAFSPPAARRCSPAILRARFSGNNQQPTNVSLLRDLSGVFLVMAMLHKADFFQAQINECRHLAKYSENQNDRQFWLKMAQRWEGLLEGRSPDTPAPQRIEKIIFRRARRFANRYRAA